MSLPLPLVQFSACHNLDPSSLVPATPLPNPLAQSPASSQPSMTPLHSSPDVGTPQTRDSAAKSKERLISLIGKAANFSLEKLKETFHPAMARVLYEKAIERCSVESSIFLMPELMDLRIMGITISKEGQIIDGPFLIVEQEHLMISRLLSKEKSENPRLVRLAAEAAKLTRTELNDTLPLQLRKTWYKHGMEECDEGSGSFALLEQTERRSGILINEDSLITKGPFCLIQQSFLKRIGPKIVAMKKANVTSTHPKEPLSEGEDQVFKQLEKYGFGGPFQLQYVDGPNGLVPADAITQEMQSHFPSLDVNSLL
ncbi:hypothetical protein PCANC_17672 [Puccinia coronata f. sp. avenae]|uniref:Uncharacterized protein n=1 Tax=Puccinia coronata f. sp. avenae TaxID=200324 RepID=A0A2N5U963_9BASI|nr:hypothetical protein PCANC_17672 [Puccinia coronata f. sp. avenae]